MSSPSPSLDQLRDLIRAFAAERDWGRFHTPKNLAMALAGEVGELIAELQWLTPDEAAQAMTDPATAARLRSELADVMIYLVRLADVLDVDLAEAAVTKLGQAARKYPADDVRDSPGRAGEIRLRHRRCAGLIDRFADRLPAAEVPSLRAALAEAEYPAVERRLRILLAGVPLSPEDRAALDPQSTTFQ